MWKLITTSQIFALQECLQNVLVQPQASGQGMLSQLEMRTYWCISRQRAWGVPIPVFYEKDTGKVLLNRLVEHIVQGTSNTMYMHLVLPGFNVYLLA